MSGRRLALSEQDTETKENPGPEGEGAAEEKEVDHLSDLSELEKIKLELQKEKEIATKELAEGEDEEEDSVKSADDAASTTKPVKKPAGQGPDDKMGQKVKAKVEAVDFDEDLEALISEEATLSNGFKDKAGTIFEAVLTSKLTQEVDRLESEYASNLEEEVSKSSLSS